MKIKHPNRLTNKDKNFRKRKEPAYYNERLNWKGVEMQKNKMLDVGGEMH